MENQENNQLNFNIISFNERIREYLAETSKWGKFLAIIGFIGIGLIIIAGVAVTISLTFFKSFNNTSLPLGALGIIYIFIAILQFYPVKHLYKFSVNIRAGLNSNDQRIVTYGFESLKSMFKYLGILTIVVISVYILLIVVVLPLTLFAF